MSLPDLLSLAHELGREDRRLAILGEGNVSWRRDDGTFAVKASGSNLASLTEEAVTICRFEILLGLLEKQDTVSAEEVDAALLASRLDQNARKPSVEAIFHAWLLTLPGVRFVGHTHPCAVNGLLCSKHSETFAAHRLFPDEIVCCGTASVHVPYTDPGLRLAQEIRQRVEAFRQAEGDIPRVILLANHGLIAIGQTPAAVLAATFMAEKAATIYAAASAVAGSPRFLTAAEVARIAKRPDEHHRRKTLGI
jgi:rhamnose utilization protein RhaD (predicted bifunctional aldolase and dehydrogenase)